VRLDQVLQACLKFILPIRSLGVFRLRTSEHDARARASRMMPMTMTMRRPDELAQVQVAHSRGHHVTSRRYVLVSSGIVEVRQGERVASCCGLPSKETWPWPWSAPSGPEQLCGRRTLSRRPRGAVRNGGRGPRGGSYSRASNRFQPCTPYMRRRALC
jgi:hypothetical protein